MGCAPLSDVFRDRDKIADRIARESGMEKYRLRSGAFDLVGYRRFSTSADPALSVYLEGDGLAYLEPDLISRDPTPRDPVGLELAARDVAGNVAYLARPCQYQTKAGLQRCNHRYWTTARFAPEVVEATDRAIDALVETSYATAVRLYGYSGGGVLAALVAARRHDVVSLATIGAPLDHATWTAMGDYSALADSLNPVDTAMATAGIRQIHLLGEDDDIVPRQVVETYIERVRAAGGRSGLVIVPDTDHWCCWPSQWPTLMRAHLL